MTKGGKVRIAGAVAVPVLAAALWWASRPLCSGLQPRYPDKGNLYRIAQALVAASPDGEFPMREGALDVYAAVRSGKLAGSHLRSARSGTGPTDDEIARGDYTNFPWERRRGDGRGTSFPLLWEREPNDQGLHLVALSDGHAYFWTPEQLRAALAR